MDHGVLWDVGATCSMFEFSAARERYFSHSPLGSSLSSGWVPSRNFNSHGSALATPSTFLQPTFVLGRVHLGPICFRSVEATRIGKQLIVEVKYEDEPTT